MRLKILREAFLSWTILIGGAVLEGIFRRLVLEPVLPNQVAEIIGIGLVLFTACIIADQFIRRDRFPNVKWRLIQVGVLWVLFTVAFEFVFFHFAIGLSWSTIAQNYNVFDGRPFVLGLVVTAFVPLLVARWRSDREHPTN